MSLALASSFVSLTPPLFITIINTGNIVTEIRMSNFYFEWKWNHFIGHQLQVNIELKKKINEVIFNFNSHYFCFSVNYLTLTKFKKWQRLLLRYVRIRLKSLF